MCANQISDSGFPGLKEHGYKIETPKGWFLCQHAFNEISEAHPNFGEHKDSCSHSSNSTDSVLNKLLLFK